MEWKKSIQLFSMALMWVVLLVSQISAFPSSQSYASSQLGAYSPAEDYELPQPGWREVVDELERQGGLSGPMMPRSYFNNVGPNHKMARKSQRSNTLRLRFGKRSEVEGRSSVMGAENPIPWKIAEEGTVA